MLCCLIIAGLVRKPHLPQFVNKWMEDGEIPLNGDGDCHEDAGTEEDVVEGIEEVGEHEMVEEGNLTRH